MSYLGTNYHGWQIQKNANSVEATLEKALSLLLKEKINLTGSSRTDTGVHAEQQFAHFDSLQAIGAKDFLHKINAFLPRDIFVRDIFQVNEKLHCRFDAISRSYEYRICKHKNPFLTGLSYYPHYPVEWAKMQEGALQLLQYKDFQAFSKVHTEVDHFYCDLYESKWIERKELWIYRIRANRFLRGMVRALVGTMLEMGKGKLSAEELDAIFHSRDRKKAGWSVPPEALFLTEVRYREGAFEK